MEAQRYRAARQAARQPAEVSVQKTDDQLWDQAEQEEQIAMSLSAESAVSQTTRPGEVQEIYPSITVANASPVTFARSSGIPPPPHRKAPGLPQ